MKMLKGSKMAGASAKKREEVQNVCSVISIEGPKWGPQIGNPKNIVGIYLPGSLHSYYIPILLRFAF